MFFGRIVSSKNPFVFSAEEVDETVGDVICISNVALAPTSNVRITIMLGRCHSDC